MLEAQNEELREEVERLRCQLESRHVSVEQHINGDVNGAASPMIPDAVLPQSNGT